jgi:hypothetical protein
MKKLLIVPLLLISFLSFGQAGVSIPGVAAPRHSVPTLTYRYWGVGFHIVLDRDSADLRYSPITNPIFLGLVKAPNYYSTSATPTIAVGANAGTGATVSIVGTNQDGIITVNTGTGATTGILCTITMSGAFAYPNSCTPVITHSSGPAITGDVTVIPTATTWQVYMNGGVSSSSTYTWTYHNGGY